MAAILPLVNECSAPNAQILYNDLRPGKGTTGSYEVIKAALERSYDCLGVFCEDVGGLMNLRGNGYLDGAEACGGVKLLFSSKVDYDDVVDNDKYTYDNDDDPNEQEDSRVVGVVDDNDDEPLLAETSSSSNNERQSGDTKENLPLVGGLIVGAVAIALAFTVLDVSMLYDTTLV